MKYNENYAFFMQRCFDLATLGRGAVKTNPLVGAVLTHRDKVIGEGYHERYGGPHAEVQAVNLVTPADRRLIKEAVLYVSLEPCFHHGKTPACVDLILREQIPKVVVGCIDPNPKVAGKSVGKLRAAGVEVIVGIKEAEGKNLIRPFIKNIIQQRPYIILKWAQSADGYIGEKNQSVWISNNFSRRLTHKWRAESDAILIGAHTVRIDDPQLDNRYYFGASPIRISFDKDRTFPPDAHILDDASPTLIFTDYPGSINSNASTRFLPSPASLKDLLSQLYAQNIGTLLVEGGARLLNSFIREDLWDEARIIQSRTALSDGIVAPTLPYWFRGKSFPLDDNDIFYYYHPADLLSP